jgi:hypothetical protein
MSATKARNGWKVTLKEPSISASIIPPKMSGGIIAVTKAELGMRNMATTDTMDPARM